MRMSDAIAAYILGMLEEDERECVELQRNVLAGEIGCVPSQINYVLSSRFTPEQGYIVESRRGGGGYIRIQRIPFRSEIAALTHIINSIGDGLSSGASAAIIENIFERELVSEQTARAMLAAVSEATTQCVPPVYRDALRASVLKRMLTAVAISR